jgi:hypothetical protein
MSVYSSAGTGRSYLATGAFWAGACERALKTIAQSVLALLTVDATTNILNIDFKSAAGVALTAGAISILMSIVSAPIGPAGSASIVNDRPTAATEAAETLPADPNATAELPTTNQPRPLRWGP